MSDSIKPKFLQEVEKWNLAQRDVSLVATVLVDNILQELGADQKTNSDVKSFFIDSRLLIDEITLEGASVLAAGVHERGEQEDNFAVYLRDKIANFLREAGVDKEKIHTCLSGGLISSLFSESCLDIISGLQTIRNSPSTIEPSGPTAG